MTGPKLLILPGDGIGPEVMEQASRVLEWLALSGGLQFAIEQDLVGGCSIDAHGVPLTPATLEKAKAADAVLLGAVGGPKWDGVDYAIRPEAGLLQLRSGLGLFANLRPATVFDPLVNASTLKAEVVRGLDLLIVRELTGGVYFGEPRGISALPGGGRRGVNTQVYTTDEIVRVGRVAFDMARRRQQRVCSVDKANVMESGRLWREEITRLHATEYADIALSHMYADNCAMQLLRNPRQFDIIVTDNLFGDMLSDEAAMLTGSLGLLPSASLGTRTGNHQPALYEPIHGSAPDIAGRDLANPVAAILSLAMLLRYSLRLEDEARRIEEAVSAVLAAGIRTADIMSPGCQQVGTRDMGSAIIQRLAQRQAA